MYIHICSPSCWGRDRASSCREMCATFGTFEIRTIMWSFLLPTLCLTWLHDVQLFCHYSQWIAASPWHWSHTSLTTTLSMASYTLHTAFFTQIGILGTIIIEMVENMTVWRLFNTWMTCSDDPIKFWSGGPKFPENLVHQTIIFRKYWSARRIMVWAQILRCKHFNGTSLCQSVRIVSESLKK